MPTLRLLALACLQRLPATGATRYDLMIMINQIYSPLDLPYSPGAVYHEIKKLSADNMIKINHIGVALLPLGLQTLHTEITQGVLPRALTPLLARCLATQLIDEDKIRDTGIKRLSIELINNNHIPPKSGSAEPGKDSPLDSWRLFISNVTREIVLRFVAKN